MAQAIRIGNARRKKVKTVAGNTGKLKALAELKKTNKEIDDRFKVSSKLFVKRDKLMEKLGLDR